MLFVFFVLCCTFFSCSSQLRGLVSLSFFVTSWNSEHLTKKLTVQRVDTDSEYPVDLGLLLLKVKQEPGVLPSRCCVWSSLSFLFACILKAVHNEFPVFFVLCSEVVTNVDIGFTAKTFTPAAISPNRDDPWVATYTLLPPFFFWHMWQFLFFFFSFFLPPFSLSSPFRRESAKPLGRKLCCYKSCSAPATKRLANKRSFKIIYCEKHAAQQLTEQFVDIM